MIELPKRKYEKAHECYLDEEIKFPLMLAVMSKQQGGGIYTNSLERPKSFFAYNRFGFCQVFGGKEDNEFNQALYELIFTDSGFPIKYLLWYNPGSDWLRLSKGSVLQGSFKFRSRTQFRLNSKKFKRISSQLLKTPNLQMEQVNNKTKLEEAAVFKLDLPTRFWNGTDDFLQNGLAILGYWDGRPSTICYAATTAGNLAEVDVATLEEYRGKGIATFVTLAFNELSLNRGLVPNWDCFDENEASYHLALKTGFEVKHKYPFLSVFRDFSK